MNVEQQHKLTRFVKSLQSVATETGVPLEAVVHMTEIETKVEQNRLLAALVELATKNSR